MLFATISAIMATMPSTHRTDYESLRLWFDVGDFHISIAHTGPQESFISSIAVDFGSLHWVDITTCTTSSMMAIPTSDELPIGMLLHKPQFTDSEGKKIRAYLDKKIPAQITVTYLSLSSPTQSPPQHRSTDFNRSHFIIRTFADSDTWP